MSAFGNDPQSLLALDVAKGMAAAMGDERCGTEHLLFGLIATAGTEMKSLAELFALDRARVERSVADVRQEWCTPGTESPADSPLSTRLELALCAKPACGDTVGPFDLLAGCLTDPRSGAATVLRRLGVRSAEVRRLAEIGAARLTDEEVDRLVGSLDRRSEQHNGWWGPRDDSHLAGVELSNGPALVVAKSETAVLTLDRVVASDEGFGITLTVTSIDNWLLPPRWEPTEVLIPGLGGQPEMSPDVISIDIAFDDGAVLNNRSPLPRFRRDLPIDGSLVLLNSRQVVENRRDRRVAEQRTESADWWAWPLPPRGTVTIGVRWPAESIDGSVEIDASRIRGCAEALRES